MADNMLKSICWDITSRCNEHCGFCYRNPHNQELYLESNIVILKKLIDFGVDKISFVGGEPLLYKDLFNLLEWGRAYAKGKTLFSITTNAILLTETVSNSITVKRNMMEKVLELFDWITLPLDAANDEIQSLMGRNSLHYSRIIEVLEYMNKGEYDNKIKINTVISKINIENILELSEVLNFYHINRWKVFRFLPSRGRALEAKDKYYISEEEYLKKIQEIKKLNFDRNMKLSVNDYDNFDDSYITLSSDGKLVVYNNAMYSNQVNLLTEDIEMILKYINIDKHKKNRSDFLDA